MTRQIELSTESKMSKPRFSVGTVVMCNFGASGWKLGRIIAIDYREHNWAIGQTAPYQVILEENSTLIYVPEDDDRCCRLATVEDTLSVGNWMLWPLTRRIPIDWAILIRSA